MQVRDIESNVKEQEDAGKCKYLCCTLIILIILILIIMAITGELKNKN